LSLVKETLHNRIDLGLQTLETLDAS